MAASVSTSYPEPSIILMTWAGLVGGETGNSIQASRWPDKTAQASGTFTTIDLQGSNDGTNWAVLHDAAGDPLQFTAAGIKMIAENPLYIRPVAVGAGSGCLLTIVGVQNTLG